MGKEDEEDEEEEEEGHAGADALMMAWATVCRRQQARDDSQMIICRLPLLPFSALALLHVYHVASIYRKLQRCGCHNTQII